MTLSLEELHALHTEKTQLRDQYLAEANACIGALKLIESMIAKEQETKAESPAAKKK